jgi:hypothetical protein
MLAGCDDAAEFDLFAAVQGSNEQRSAAGLEARKLQMDLCEAI